MKILINTALATKRRRQATVLSVAGILVLLVGLYLNFQHSAQLVLAAYMALILGSLLSFWGVSLAGQWVRPPRAEEAIGEAMKGAGPSYALYHWVLPADHVLLAPWGLVLFRVFNVDGPAKVRGTKWHDTRPFYRKLFSLGRQPVRNPERILGIEADQLRKALVAKDPALADVPMQPVGLFTNPRVELSVADPNLPALRLDALRDWLRTEGKRPGLAPATRRALDAALDAVAGATLGTDKMIEAQAKSEEAAKARAADKAAKEAQAKAEAKAEKRAKARGKAK
jgi:hypothetical protein